jgi:hypothetical protein
MSERDITQELPDGVSYEAFVAERRRRISELPEPVRGQLLARLAEEIRTGSVRVFACADEKIPEDPRLIVFSEEYISLPTNICSRCSWKEAVQRFIANDYEKLNKAIDMQGGGQLFGIDRKGKLLIKDRGVEPVMFGYDDEECEGLLLRIYNRDPKQMAEVRLWANYYEILERVLEEGYEMFEDDGSRVPGDEMIQAERHTKEPFVASANRDEPRMSWLNSGTNFGSGEDIRLARDISFDPAIPSRLFFAGDDPESRSVNRGVVRMLRV